MIVIVLMVSVMVGPIVSKWAMAAHHPTASGLADCGQHGAEPNDFGQTHSRGFDAVRVAGELATGVSLGTEPVLAAVGVGSADDAAADICCDLVCGAADAITGRVESVPHLAERSNALPSFESIAGHRLTIDLPPPRTFAD